MIARLSRAGGTEVLPRFRPAAPLFELDDPAAEILAAEDTQRLVDGAVKVLSRLFPMESLDFARLSVWSDLRWRTQRLSGEAFSVQTRLKALDGNVKALLAGQHLLTCDGQGFFIGILALPAHPPPAHIPVWGLPISPYDESDSLPSECLLILWKSKINLVEKSSILQQPLALLQNQWRWLERLRHSAQALQRDDLTGLFNLRSFAPALAHELARSHRGGHGFALIFMDLDHFKRVNDEHGHLAGSDLLVQVARLLHSLLREVDTLVRYGGDEFVAILVGAGETEALGAAERLREAVASTRFRLRSGAILPNDDKLSPWVEARLTLSAGVALFPQHGRSTQDLLALADRALYQSKWRGKNRVSLVQSVAPPGVDP